MTIKQLLNLYIIKQMGKEKTMSPTLKMREMDNGGIMIFGKRGRNKNKIYHHNISKKKENKNTFETRREKREIKT